MYIILLILFAGPFLALIGLILSFIKRSRPTELKYPIRLAALLNITPPLFVMLPPIAGVSIIFGVLVSLFYFVKMIANRKPAGSRRSKNQLTERHYPAGLLLLASIINAGCFLIYSNPDFAGGAC